MQAFILPLLILVIAGCAFASMLYERRAGKRTSEKKKNQYNDRV